MKSDNLEKELKREEEILSAKDEQEETPVQEWDTRSRFPEGA